MERGKNILVVCHCLLNANAKLHPLALARGVYWEQIASYIQSGVGFFQLPCPETAYLGLNRWGMTREQYDHPNFRTHCRNILHYPIIQLQAFAQAGYEIVGMMGMDGSPNCGVNLTCEGYRGGELSDLESTAKQITELRLIPGKGVFMEELIRLLDRKNIKPALLAMNETPAYAEAI